MHNQIFKNYSLEYTKPLNKNCFEKWVKELPTSVLRGKGIIHFLEEPFSQSVWQKVGMSSIVKRMPFKPENKFSKILLIGNKNMPSMKELKFLR